MEKQQHANPGTLSPKIMAQLHAWRPRLAQNMVLILVLLGLKVGTVIVVTAVRKKVPKGKKYIIVIAETGAVVQAVPVAVNPAVAVTPAVRAHALNKGHL